MTQPECNKAPYSPKYSIRSLPTLKYKIAEERRAHCSEIARSNITVKLKNTHVPAGKKKYEKAKNKNENLEAVMARTHRTNGRREEMRHAPSRSRDNRVQVYGINIPKNIKAKCKARTHTEEGAGCVCRHVI